MLFEQLVGGLGVKGLIVDPGVWWIGGCFRTHHRIDEKAEEGRKKQRLSKKGLKKQMGRNP